MIIYQSRIYRADLRANPDVLYVFGDNVKRYGMAGQAAEMRGEPNAVGIATKWSPGNHPADFFSDDYQYERCTGIIFADYETAMLHDFAGGILIIPLDGIGTGLSDLPNKAPKIYEYICSLGLGAQS
jgi:hypothetical protein